MIKLLKSQDENYIRTVRASGQKVCPLPIQSKHCPTHRQKIDKLKLQLATMVNLLDGSDVLNSDEMQVLQDAGLVPTSQKRKTKGRHIIFVEDEQQGKIHDGNILPLLTRNSTFLHSATHKFSIGSVKYLALFRT